MGSIDKKTIISCWKKRYRSLFTFSLQENFFELKKEKVSHFAQTTN